MSRQRDVLVVLVSMAVVGLVAGVIWWLLADPVVATRADNGVVSGEAELANQISADGWFAAIGLVACLVAALVLTVWRRCDEVVTLLALLAGSVLASWLCLRLGSLIGPDPAAETLAHASVGKTAEDQLQLHAWVVLLAWPFGSLVGSLLVLLGPMRSDRRAARRVVQ